VPESFEQDVVDLIGVASALGAEAREVLRTKEASDAAIKPKIEQAADALIANGRILATEKTAAIAELSDPIRAVEFITALAHQRLPSEGIAPMGTPGGSAKTASADVFLGGRRSDKQTPADTNFLAAMGLNPADFG
jgi:hypothetical protein